MATKRKKSKKVVFYRPSSRKVAERQRKIKAAATIAGHAAKEAATYSSALARKHITKANAKKAWEASKKATQKLKALFQKKKKEPQRITMSIYRK